jgi:outer membrane protein TolC
MPSASIAQNQQEGDTVLRIPPLGMLIEAGLAFSPLLDEQRALIKIREWQHKSARNEWGRYVMFFTEMRYGSIDILVSNGGTITYGDKSNSTRFNVGARFQVSMFDLLDLRRKNLIANEQVEFEKFKKAELERMIKDDVIRLWNKLVAYKEIAAINEDHVTAQKGNFFYAEQQFKAGDIALGEYVRIKEISIKADAEYQLAKKEFRETYLLLESLVGSKLSEIK